jgi:hypothetical protein
MINFSESNKGDCPDGGGVNDLCAAKATEEMEVLNALHKAQGYSHAKEFTDEEKEKLGFNKNDMIGILGTFGIGNLPTFMEGASKGHVNLGDNHD